MSPRYVMEPHTGMVYRAVDNRITLGHRPVVVIDPEDEETVERLRVALLSPGWSGGVATLGHFETLQAALRELAKPATPKPEEPTGLGAVIEDAEGVKWLRVCWHVNDCNSWRPWDAVMSDVDKSSSARRSYAEINAVRVLSEGVPS